MTCWTRPRWSSDELSQRRESGYDVAELEEVVRLAIDSGSPDEMDAAYTRLEQSSLRTDWPHEEPSTLEEIRGTLSASERRAAPEARRRRSARPDVGGMAGTVRGLQPGQARRGMEPREDPGVPRPRRRLSDHRLPPGAGPVARRAEAQLVLARDHPRQHRVHGARRRHRLHDPGHAHPRGRMASGSALPTSPRNGCCGFPSSRCTRRSGPLTAT